MSSVTGPGTPTPPPAKKEVERQRLGQVEAKQVQELKEKHGAGFVEANDITDDKAVIRQDTFVKEAQIEGVTSESQREALYARFNTDGEAGLADAEFDAMFDQAETLTTQVEVQPGDTYIQLTNQLIADGKAPAGATWQDLQAANGYEPTQIPIGAEMKLPEAWVTHQINNLDTSASPTASTTTTSSTTSATTGSTTTSSTTGSTTTPANPYAGTTSSTTTAPADPYAGTTSSTTTPANPYAGTTSGTTSSTTTPSNPYGTGSTTGTASTTTASTPAPNPQAQADLDAMLADPTGAPRLDAARQGAVQTLVQQQADAKLAEAAAPGLSPTARAAKAQEAADLVEGAINATEQAGYPDISRGLAAKGGQIETQVQNYKVAAGDREATEEAFDDAGTDPAKLQDLHDALPAGDPRRAAIQPIIDGTVNQDVAEHIINALKDQDGTRGDIADAVHESEGDPVALAAIAAAVKYKSLNNDDAGVREEMAQLEQAISAMSQASEGVRKELAKGFDDSGNYGDFQRAVDKANTPEDIRALREFAEHKGLTADDSRDDQRIFDQVDRLKAVETDFAALHGNDKVWEQVRNLLHDDTNNREDLEEAAVETQDAGTLAALSRLAEAVGENETAVNLTTVAQPEHRERGRDYRERIIKDGL